MGPAEDEVASKNKKVSCNFTDGKFTMLARGGFTLNYYAPYTYFKIQPNGNTQKWIFNLPKRKFICSALLIAPQIADFTFKGKSNAQNSSN